jgi:hypothetical protein
VVAEVDVGLPCRQRLLAHLGEAEHDLQPGADALLEGGEGELAGGAHEDHAAGDPDDVLGLLALLELPHCSRPARGRWVRGTETG